EVAIALLNALGPGSVAVEKMLEIAHSGAAYLFPGQFRYPAPEAPARRQAMGSDVTAEQRRRMIAEAAYFRAQRRGFENGDSTADWLAAEAEIERALAQRDLTRVSITQHELEQLMQRAREAQLELIAE